MGKVVAKKRHVIAEKGERLRVVGECNAYLGRQSTYEFPRLITIIIFFERISLEN